MPKTITGVAMVGDYTSANGRWYEWSAVRAAVAGAQPRVQAGTMLMLSSHRAADADDITSAVARITALTCDEATKTARYRAELLDTVAGRNVAALLNRPGARVPVSLRGAWTGEMRQSAGGLHGDALTLDSIDFTTSPGIAAAHAVAEAADPRRVFETATIDPPPPPTPEQVAAMNMDQFRAYVASEHAAALAAARARTRDFWTDAFARVWQPGA